MDQSPADLAHIFEPVRADLEKVELEFGRHLQSHVGLIPEIGTYLQASGGKRLRPAVLLMAARLTGYAGDQAVLYAGVVEFIHTATLVHDDMIDDSTLRRGRETVHARWGNEISVLLGDFLYIKSLALALSNDSLDVIRLLCDVTLRMIEGELYQLSKNGDVDISEDEHFDIIRRKTAYLFGGSAEIGAILGGAPPEQQAALREYGFNLGIAFQIVDDLLDLTGSQAAIGKPVGGDLREGKLTLPVIHMLRQQPSTRDAVVGIVQDRVVDAWRWRAIADGLAETGAVEYALRRAAEYAGRARRSLEVFPAGPDREALMALPDFVLARDR
ncbi:MAG TPA: polyprenyl synthetase family protein [Vicinamibacterales bacterium]|nr:polyprenyl synthetase family protein [Vicinamibacterales bacterium]